MSRVDTFKNNDFNLPQIKNPKYLIEQPEGVSTPESTDESDVEDASRSVNLSASELYPNNTDLQQELAAARQMLEYQQSLINTLTRQLADSDRRIAQLTEDLAESQYLCDRQQHQRVETEEVCRDLRTQLCRQQQQALQLKTALDQSNEQNVTAPATLEEDFRAVVARKVVNLPPHQSIAQKRPIQPWSAAPIQEILDPVTLCDKATRQSESAELLSPAGKQTATPRSSNRAAHRIDLPKFVHC